MADLVNTTRDGAEHLPDPAALARFVTEQEISGRFASTAAELDAVRGLRVRIAAFWDTGTDDAVRLVNDLLAETGARPYLARHDGWDWHLHVTAPEAPLADRIGADVAMAVGELVRGAGLDRLRRCAAEGCRAVLVDLSRNRSKRYCDTGNCGNRLHVAAYRARKRAG